MPVTQNFSVPAGDAAELNFDCSPDDVGTTLLGSTVYWCVYEQECGVASGDAIVKKVLDHGLQIIDPTDLTFQVILREIDTVDLSGNYYHEAFIVDEDEAIITVTIGIMTVNSNPDRDLTIEELPA